MAMVASAGQCRSNEGVDGWKSRKVGRKRMGKVKWGGGEWRRGVQGKE
jgi:hypothetical protein